MRQPARVSGDFTLGEAPNLPTSRAFPQDQPSPPWLTAGDATALPTRHNDSFDAKPVKLSILMAVYNEERTITRVIDEILKAKCPCEIELIVVDDGSTDRTPILLSRVDDPRVMVFHHPANQGKARQCLTQHPWHLAHTFFRSMLIWSTSQKIFRGFLSLY